MLRNLQQNPEGGAKAVTDYFVRSLDIDAKRREIKYVIVDSSDPSIHISLQASYYFEFAMDKWIGTSISGKNSMNPGCLRE